MVDLTGPLRELAEDFIGDAVEFGDTMLRLLPFHVEPGGEFGSEVGVIKSREGALVHLDSAGIQRQPPAIRSTDSVGDHRMSVELGVQST